MGASFSDITLYMPTAHEHGSDEYIRETRLNNFVSDLYVRHMNGYKPPRATRITIQPAYFETWDRTWKNGSLFSIAPYFDLERFGKLDKAGKCMYVLEIIHESCVTLSLEHGWNRSIFENAYARVLNDDFRFHFEYPQKKSRDRKKTAKLIMSKDEFFTTVSVRIEMEDRSIQKALFNKENEYWYDAAYILTKHGSWLDNLRFGIRHKPWDFEIWYSLEKDEVGALHRGQELSLSDFDKWYYFGRLGLSQDDEKWFSSIKRFPDDTD